MTGLRIRSGGSGGPDARRKRALSRDRERAADEELERVMSRPVGKRKGKKYPRIAPEDPPAADDSNGSPPRSPAIPSSPGVEALLEAASLVQDPHATGGGDRIGAGPALDAAEEAPADPLSRGADASAACAQQQQQQEPNDHSDVCERPEEREDEEEQRDDDGDEEQQQHPNDHGDEEQQQHPNDHDDEEQQLSDHDDEEQQQQQPAYPPVVRKGKKLASIKGTAFGILGMYETPWDEFAECVWDGEEYLPDPFCRVDRLNGLARELDELFGTDVRLRSKQAMENIGRRYMDILGHWHPSLGIFTCDEDEWDAFAVAACNDTLQHWPRYNENPKAFNQIKKSLFFKIHNKYHLCADDPEIDKRFAKVGELFRAALYAKERRNLVNERLTDFEDLQCTDRPFEAMRNECEEIKVAALGDVCTTSSMTFDDALAIIKKELHDEVVVLLDGVPYAEIELVTERQIRLAKIALELFEQGKIDWIPCAPLQPA